ncbi:hypothetical protein [Mycobacterium conspicuum]|jgi:hypothetical protein|uniref:Uncharacterized protein n=1 Tax=Mycobacterium conspicuum TaxID=44010 RepID=A0A1X1SRH0_9MYCO|nr:hypothetical protein [Mycobacterium conspicuum]ORV32652.1 hypothetical protein AWC00_01420 [Mycobacterium conspicuum]BBZ39807.1 hypothetical protein MCNS_28700 [Mycobacterium conspicuum]
MAPIVVICVALTALCIGYHLGRRAGSMPVPWKKRTSRVALARAALNLVLLVSARRVQRNYLIRALKFVER